MSFRSLTIIAITAFCLLQAVAQTTRADIKNWQTGQTIPGTEGIVPGPDLNLDNRNTEARNLRYADLSPGLDLSNSDMHDSWFDFARFKGSNLFQSSFSGARLTGADFTDALIVDVNFGGSDFTKEQLYSTASYKNHNLAGVLLSGSVRGWDFVGQNLTGAVFSSTTWTDANLTDAIVNNASFPGRTMDKEQLYSTASYKNHDLSGIKMRNNNLAGWNFFGQNLRGAVFGVATLTNADLREAILQDVNFGNAKMTGADLSRSDLTNASFRENGTATLTDAIFTDAIVTGANFPYATLHGFTREQLYSTASYKKHDLAGISLRYNDLTNWSFANQNLTDANLDNSTLSGADFTNAVVAHAQFLDATGLTKDQLYSTASYKNHDLSGIDLSLIDLSGWDFSDQNLTGADLRADLQGAIFARAVIMNAGFMLLTKEQLYSTASYAKQDLGGVGLESHNMTGWNLAGQSLINASLSNSILVNCDFTSADLRSLRGLDPTGAILRNAILPDGSIAPLALAATDQLAIRDYTLGITVKNSMTLADGSILEMRFADAGWQSIITVDPGVVPDLGGTLALRFADGANPATLVGTKFHLFNWNGQLAAGDHFDRIDSLPGYVWDTSQLYTSGDVTLMAVPEPSAMLLAAVCVVLAGAARLGRRRSHVGQGLP